MFDTRLIMQNFGNAAPEYDDNALLQKRVRAHCITLSRKYWPKGATVIDLGCGTGVLSGECPEWNIIGIDLSLGMCMQANSRSRIINASAEAIPLKGNAADGVFSSLMLQWANATAGIWQEIERVLKPGSYAVISTLVDGTLYELAEAFRAVDRLPHVSGFLQAHEVVEAAERAGLGFVSARQAKVVEHYSDTIALMRSLKDIGAANKHRHRRRGMMTPRQFTAIERVYARFRQTQGLPATWQVLYLVVQKP